MHAFDRQTDRRTDRRTDRQTEFPSLYRDCIPCSAVKIMTLNNKILHILRNQPYNSPVKDLYAEYNTLPIPQLHNPATIDSGSQICIPQTSPA